jgi:hypothetical protein
LVHCESRGRRGSQEASKQLAHQKMKGEESEDKRGGYTMAVCKVDVYGYATKSSSRYSTVIPSCRSGREAVVDWGDGLSSMGCPEGPGVAREPASQAEEGGWIRAHRMPMTQKLNQFCTPQPATQPNTPPHACFFSCHLDTHSEK